MNHGQGPPTEAVPSALRRGPKPARHDSRKAAGAGPVWGGSRGASRSAQRMGSPALYARDGVKAMGAQFEPSVRHDDLCLGQLCPVVAALVWGSQMSTLQRRLAGVTDTIAHLNAQIRELDQARDLVRKARLSARRARRKSRRKRTRI
jgi:hypothetical protein